mgnify:CR=1 FL=1
MKTLFLIFSLIAVSSFAENTVPDKEKVREVIRKNLEEIRKCYEKVAELQPDLAGNVTLDWSLTENGSVEKIKVQSSSLQSKEVENCVADLVKSLKFPKPMSEKTVHITYPFVFGKTAKPRASDDLSQH